jgi:hypothetical protein
MKRTDAPNSVNGLYVDRDGNRPGTLSVAADRNMVQEELANAVECVMPLDGTSGAQLAKMFQVFFTSKPWGAVTLGDLEGEVRDVHIVGSNERLFLFLSMVDQDGLPISHLYQWRGQAEGWTKIESSEQYCSVLDASGAGGRLTVLWRVDDYLGTATSITGYDWDRTEFQEGEFHLLGVGGGRIVVADANGATAVSADGGASWHPAKADGHNVRCLEHGHANTWILGGDATLFVSEDGGLSWVPRPLPEYLQIFDLAYSDGVWMVAAVETTGRVRVYTSPNDGKTWDHRTSPGIAGGSPIRLHAAGGTWIMAYRHADRTRCEIKRSIDRGVTWKTLRQSASRVTTSARSLGFAGGVWALADYSQSSAGITYSAHEGFEL